MLIAEGTKCVRAVWLTVVLGLVTGFTGSVRAGNIETVRIGNAGNAANPIDGDIYRFGDQNFGAVSYEYNIGKYEVTAAQYTAFLNAVADADTYGLYDTRMTSTSGCQIQRIGEPGDYTYIVETEWANRPVNYVTWADAARFTNWLHNNRPTGAQDLSTTEDGAYFLNGAITTATLNAVTREADWIWAIPTEDEWYKAAYHKKNDGLSGNYFEYPTQSDLVPGRDITEITNPGNNANYDDTGTSPGSPYFLTDVGEFDLSVGPYGTYDQGGNVSEWNEAILTAGSSYTSRGIRGGSYLTYSDILLASHRGFTLSTVHPSFGFRVVAVPEPASLALMCAGVLVLATRRR